MPAPKNPNTAEANRKRRELGDATAAKRLAEAGYVVLPPNAIDRLTAEYRKAAEDYPSDAEYWQAMARGAEAVAQLRL